MFCLSVSSFLHPVMFWNLPYILPLRLPRWSVSHVMFCSCLCPSLRYLQLMVECSIWGGWGRMDDWNKLKVSPILSIASWGRKRLTHLSLMVDSSPTLPKRLPWTIVVQATRCWGMVLGGKEKVSSIISPSTSPLAIIMVSTHQQTGVPIPGDTSQVRGALYCTVVHCTVLYCTVPYCTIVHCTELVHYYQ